MSEKQQITVKQAWEVIRDNFIRTIETNEKTEKTISGTLGIEDPNPESDELEDKWQKILQREEDTLTGKMAYIAKNSESFELYAWLTYLFFMHYGEKHGKAKVQAEMMLATLKQMAE